jgi:hypothetical protein
MGAKERLMDVENARDCLNEILTISAVVASGRKLRKGKSDYRLSDEALA